MIKLLQNNESNNKKGKTHLTHKSKNNSDKPNFMLNGAFLCSLETHIARDLFGGNSGGLLKIGEKRERRKAPPARRRVRVLSFWRNFLVVVVLLTLGLLRFVVHSFGRFRWEREVLLVCVKRRKHKWEIFIVAYATTLWIFDLLSLCQFRFELDEGCNCVLAKAMWCYAKRRF